MQILPVDYQNRAEAIGSTGQASHSGSDFQSLLNEAVASSSEPAPSDTPPRENSLERERSGESPVYEESKSAPSSQVVDAPYNESPQPSSPFAPEPVRFTPTEMQELHDKLAKDGVSPEVLKALREVAGTPGGPTLDQVTEALLQGSMGAGAKLSERDELMLISLTKKLQDVDGSLLNTLKSGNAKAGLEALMQSLAKLEAQGQPGLEISREEMNALGKALRLSPHTRDALQKNFGPADSLTLNSEQMRHMLATATKEANDSAASLETLMKSLAKHLQPIVNAAEKREEAERMAGMLEDRMVGNRRILIADKMSDTAPGRESEAGPVTTSKDMSVAQKEELEGKTGAGLQAAESRISPKQVAEQAARERENAFKNPGTDAATITRKLGKNNESATETSLEGRQSLASSSSARQSEDPRFQQAFLGEREGSSQQEGRQNTRESKNAKNVLNNITVAQGPGMFQPTEAFAAKESAPLTSQTRALIDQGVLTAQKNGVHKLEVQLNPVELGALTVTLTSRNGEVSALIQPERAETAALIAQQVEQIRAHLEGQGIRVEKVEVQTQLSEQQQQWQSADQHNARREQAERAEELERLRRLGRNASSGIGDLAQNMHQGEQQGATANLAAGLHLIA